MNLLLIDSTQTQLVVALAVDGVVTVTKTCDEQRQHDKNINRLIQELDPLWCFKGMTFSHLRYEPSRRSQTSFARSSARLRPCLTVCLRIRLTDASSMLLRVA